MVRESGLVIIEGEDINQDREVVADVCIIGSGAGGAVLAMKLSGEGRTVVVLEKGGNHAKEEFTQREADMIPLLWKNSGIQFTQDFSVNIIQGNCVGGSTVINDAICFQTPPVILQLWREKYGIEGLSPDSVQEEGLFREVYSFLNNPSVVQVPQLNRNNDIFRQGCNALGFREGVDHGANVRNCLDCRECGFCHMGCCYDTKQSMLVTTIPRAVEKGAEVYSNCEARELIIKDRQVRGVIGHVRNKNGEYQVRVYAKIVIISAGTIASSEILLRNDLNKTGQVGKHVSLHPSPSMIADFDEEVHANRGIPMGWHLSKYSVLNGLEMPGYMIESVFVQPFQLSLALPGFGYEQKEIMSRFDHYAMVGILLRDEPSGSIALNYDKEAMISYRLSASDAKKMIEGMKMSARIFFAAGARKVITSHRKKTILYSDRDLFMIEERGVGPSDISLVSAHPQGGNRMAEKVPSVVDSTFHVRGVKNLFVCDASIFPTAVGVNPQVTIMAMAVHLANHIIRNPSYFQGGD